MNLYGVPFVKICEINGGNACMTCHVSYIYEMFHMASTILGLDLCPPASPQFTGPWNEMPRPLMVIT